MTGRISLKLLSLGLLLGSRLRQLLRDSDRDADRGQARRLGVPARVHRRVPRRRHRRCGRQRGNGPAAAQPASDEIESASGGRGRAAADGSRGRRAARQGQAAGPSAAETKEPPNPASLKNEKDLEPYEHIFADADYWKKIGEEYQNPLIVTGTVLFTPHSQSGMVQREQEVIDALGRRRVEPVREYMERKGFILQEKFIFIDGRSGAQIHWRRDVPRGAALQPERQHAGAVVLFRADGRHHPALPEHAQHAARPRVAGSHQIDSRARDSRGSKSCGHHSADSPEAVSPELLSPL